MARLQILNTNNNIATIIKNIQHREEVKASFKMIRPIVKKEQGGAVSHIKVPAPLESSATYAPALENLQIQHAWHIIDDENE
eukprot:9004856-Ditylum_brightwellii.AAC.1